MLNSSCARLGPPEIQAAVRAVGMTEVCRARDARLERAVAITVLPSHLADTSLTLARVNQSPFEAAPGRAHIGANSTATTGRRIARGQEQ
jgi:hypothetical protein